MPEFGGYSVPASPTKVVYKTTTDVVNYIFDFSGRLALGENITSVAFNASVQAGTDPSPALILVGSYVTTGPIVTQPIGNGIANVVYNVTCTVSTSAGQSFNQIILVDIREPVPSVSINTQQALADYCLRQLGGGSVNIEITEDQLLDCIDSAVRFYQEYHFDGLIRDYFVYKIQGTQLTLSSVTGINVNDNIANSTGNTVATVVSISGNVVTIGYQNGYIKFQVGDTINLQNESYNPIGTITNIVLGDPDLGYIVPPTGTYGVIKILDLKTILSSSDYMFNIQYQVMMAEIENIASAGMSYLYGVENYLGQLDFVLRKQKDFRYNRRMDKLYLDINWNYDLPVGNVIVAEVYKVVDENSYPALYTDIWLRKYTTALIKRTWAYNIRKYAGVQLPGGIMFDGDKYYQEAVQEIKDLEAEAIDASGPLTFMVG